MAQRTMVTHPLVVRRVQVARTQQVNRRMRRITVSGPDLGEFQRHGFVLPAFHSPAFDDHVKLIFAADGNVEAALPVQRSRSIDWPPAEHRQGRDYTPRRWDPDSGELDLDFVMHGDGPAATWAAAATPGDDLYFVGPKSSLVFPDDLDWMVLAGDETALPAIGRFLDERPVDVPVDIVVEIRDPAARQELAVRTGDRISWVLTTEHAPSTLPEAVRALQIRPGSGYYWSAGESRSLLDLRRWLRHEAGVPKTHSNVTGYWHAEDPEADQAEVPTRLSAADLLNPMPWLATRAAVDLGLFAAVGARPAGRDDLAEQLGMTPERLDPLITYLAAIGVLQLESSGEVRLGSVGEELLGDDHLWDELFGNGIEAGLLASLTGLAGGLRTGTGSWRQQRRRTLAESVEQEADLYADAVEEAATFEFVAGAVPDLSAWKDADRILLTGPGSVALARAAADRGRLDGVALLAGSVSATVLEPMVAELGVAVMSPEVAGRADLVVASHVLGHRTDAEVVAHLAGQQRHSDRILVIAVLGSTGPGTPGVHAAEHALLDLAAIGTRPRNADDVIGLAADAGWKLLGCTNIGWDHQVFDLVRRS